MNGSNYEQQFSVGRSAMLANLATHYRHLARDAGLVFSSALH
jgi:hypothetical protein